MFENFKCLIDLHTIQWQEEIHQETRQRFLESVAITDSEYIKEYQLGKCTRCGKIFKNYLK